MLARRIRFSLTHAHTNTHTNTHTGCCGASTEPQADPGRCAKNRPRESLSPMQRKVRPRQSCGSSGRCGACFSFLRTPTSCCSSQSGLPPFRVSGSNWCRSSTATAQCHSPSCRTSLIAPRQPGVRSWMPLRLGERADLPRRIHRHQADRGQSASVTAPMRCSRTRISLSMCSIDCSSRDYGDHGSV